MRLVMVPLVTSVTCSRRPGERAYGAPSRRSAASTSNSHGSRPCVSKASRRARSRWRESRVTRREHLERRDVEVGPLAAPRLDEGVDLVDRVLRRLLAHAPQPSPDSLDIEIPAARLRGLPAVVGQPAGPAASGSRPRARGRSARGRGGAPPSRTPCARARCARSRVVPRRAARRARRRRLGREPRPWYADPTTQASSAVPAPASSRVTVACTKPAASPVERRRRIQLCHSCVPSADVPRTWRA